MFRAIQHRNQGARQPIHRYLWTELENFTEHIGKNSATCPRSSIVLLALLCLFLFLVAAAVAIARPTVAVKYIFTSINILLAVVLFFAFSHDIATRKKRQRAYTKGRSNTVLTVLFTIVTLTVLYNKIWFQGLNDIVLRQESDYVHNPRFPGVAFFQQQGDQPQAHIEDSEFKCSSGYRDDHAPQCSSLTIPQALRTQSCDCGDSWPDTESLRRKENTITWLTQNTSFYAMVPHPNTVSKGAGHFLEMQVFFKYDPKKAFSLNSLTPAPGIWMAIYDPSYDIVEMMKEGQLYTVQIDANSHTVVAIGLAYNTWLNRPPNYKYQVTVSTRQNLDLVCDVSKPESYPCHLTVEMEIPSFVRRITNEEKRQDWTRVVADAGAWFALVQFLAWIISGMAWAS